MKRFTLFNTITMQKLLYLLVFVTLHISVTAQDTIYPYSPDYPFFKDSAYRVVDGTSWDMLDYPPCWLRAIEHRNVHAGVMGLAIPYHFGTRRIWQNNIPEPGSPDTIALQGVLIQIIGNDYNNPIIHYTNPVVWNYNETPHVRPYDCYLAFKSSTECGEMDTVLEAYSLYFNEPITVSGDVFLGYRIKHDHNADGFIHHDNSGVPYPAFDWVEEKCDSLYPDPIYLIYVFLPDQDTTPYLTGIVDNCFLYEPYRTICPIVSMPDTDSFSCPEVEGFGFAGMMAGSPVFAWDTAAEHDLYQVAYGPYDAPIDSLRVAEARGRFLELYDNLLSPDIYYQARVRARCHHRCPIHDTVMWTAWSAPVYFYTGDHMPDTTHHSEPEGIAATDKAMPFAIVPNPARGGERQIVEIGRQVTLQGLTLTLHDAAGHEVLRMAVKEHRFALPTQGLPAGVYMATLTALQGTATRRVVIER